MGSRIAASLLIDFSVASSSVSSSSALNASFQNLGSGALLLPSLSGIEIPISGQKLMLYQEKRPGGPCGPAA